MNIGSIGSRKWIEYITGITAFKNAIESYSNIADTINTLNTWSAIFSDSLMAQDGYSKLPNGFMIQWGYYGGGAFGPTINLPTAFTEVYSATANVANSPQAFCEIVTLTNTTITVRQQRHDAADLTVAFFYIAVGRWD